MSVSNTNQNIAKNSTYLYIRLLISMVIGLYISRVVLEELGVTNYGLYALVGGFVLMFNILTGAFSGTASRFITYAIGIGDAENLKKTIVTIINLMIIVSIFTFIIGSIAGPIVIDRYLNIPQGCYTAAVFVFYCSLFSFSMNLYSVPYQSIVIANEKMDFYAIMSIVETLAKLGLVYSLEYSPFQKLYYYAFGLAFISVIIRIIYGVYCNRHFPESKLKLILDKKITKEMSTFSFWIGAGTAIGVLKDQGTNIVINIFYGVVLNEAMGICSQIMNLLNSLSMNISLAISPQITKAYSAGNLQRSIKLTFISAKAQGFLMLFVMIPFLVELHYVLTLWLKSYPPYTLEFVFVGAIICLVHSVANAYSPLFLAIGRIRNLNIISMIINSLYVILCYVFYHQGAGVIICMELLLCVECFLMFFCYMTLKIQVGFPAVSFLKEVIVPMMIIGIIVFSITKEVRELFDESFMRLIICLITSSIILIPMVLLFGLNTKEKELVYDILNKIRHRYFIRKHN